MSSPSCTPRASAEQKPGNCRGLRAFESTQGVALMDSTSVTTIRGVPARRAQDLVRSAHWTKIGALSVAACCLFSTGCMSLLSPIYGVPSNRLPSQFLAQPKNNLLPIDVSRLRQEPPPAYLVDTGDVLGIYIEGVL